MADPTKHSPSGIAESLPFSLTPLQQGLPSHADFLEDRPLDELPSPTGAEIGQLLGPWKGSTAEYPRDENVHQVFEKIAAGFPDAIALVAGDRRLTYGKLNEEANQLAHHLRMLGVRPDALVGVLMDRSPEMVVALLGILKAGGGYLPLDATNPARRLAFLAEDAELRIVLTESGLADRVPAGIPHVIHMDADPRPFAHQSRDNPLPVAGPENLAYVNYTSGSTGEPKGVEVPHRAVVRLVINTNYVTVDHSDVFLHLSAFSFDATTFEIWGALLNGARCALMPGRAFTLESLKSEIRTQRVTILWLTASLFNTVIDMDPEALEGVEQLLVGGEALSVDHVRRAQERLPSTRIINGYGPTEGTTFTCCHPITGRIGENVTSIPLGRPVSNSEVFVLDEALRLVPPGVPGELFIGGDGLARGYLKRPELTRERFIRHPFSDSPEARLYRSGDRVRFLPDGTLEFLGRVDDQLKLRGFRIEPGEIEATLKSHDSIRDAIVLPVERQTGDKYLAAWIVAAESARISASDIRAFLGSTLPSYMVPESILLLETFPLTSVGKVDRAALRSLEQERKRKPISSGAPRSPVEEALAVIWCEILRLEAVGIHEDFFDLGGNSLLATRVISRVRSTAGLDLPIRHFFEHSTIAGLAEVLESADKSESGTDAPPIVPVERSGPLPQSFSQQRLWFLDRLHPGGAVYNLPLCVRLSGQLNVAALEAGLNGIVERHETLRTVFPSIDGRPEQTIVDRLRIAIPLDGLEIVPEDDREPELARRLEAEARRPFDLATGPVLRARLLKLGDDEHVFLLTVHHIACDGWSLDILFDELATLYESHETGEAARLPALPVQYADFAAWQRERLQGQTLEKHLAYWKQQMTAAPPMMELPMDHPRTSEALLDGGTRSIRLSDELSRSLGDLGRDQGATLFMTLLAAFEVLLWRCTGLEDMVIGCPIAGRNRSEIEGLVGLFVNTLPIRGDLSGNPTFRELLQRSREVALGGYSHQDLPLEMLVEALHPQRGLSVTPLFQVAFVLQNASGTEWHFPGLVARPVTVDCRTAKFDLTMIVDEDSAGLRVSMEYRAALFEEDRIDLMLDHFHMLALEIVANPGRRLSELSESIVPLAPRVTSPPQPIHRTEASPGADPAFTATEQALARIWGDLLERDVGRNDDFFELGGHSLLAIRLFAGIERTFGLKLPLATLFENPTIAGLAGVLHDRVASGPASSIVTIRGGGSGVGVYLLPSLGGELFVSKGLIRHLPPDQPIHGFHFSGPEADGRRFDSIEAIAGAFTRDLLRFQPHGPYCLIGYSFGGAVAFEMARQLSAGGHTVDPLVVIDAGVQAAEETKAHLIVEIARFFRNLPFWIWDVLLKASPREIADYLSRMATVLIQSPGRGLRQEARDIFDLKEVPEEHIRLMDSNLRALEKYRATAYPGLITVFRGRARPLLHSHEYDLGWGCLAPGGLDLRIMPCSHDHIMSEPHILSISSHVGELLDQAGSGVAPK